MLKLEYYQIGYDQAKQLVTFPVMSSTNGTRTKTGYVCRNFGPSAPLRKYLYFGNRGLPPIMASPEADKNTAVFVEDMISAIKVGRSYIALPALSANIDSEALKWAAKAFKWVGVWLDRDMHAKVSKLVLRGSWLEGAEYFPIYSPKDPKEYTTEEIGKWITHAIGVVKT